MCDLQPVYAALAALIVACTPGVAALVVALGNRRTINAMPTKRSTDTAPTLAQVRAELRAMIQELDPTNGGGGKGGAS